MEDTTKTLYNSQQEILSEFEKAKKRILKELSDVNKETITRFKEMLKDYNKLLYNLDKRNDEYEKFINEKLDTFTDNVDTLIADINADVEQRILNLNDEIRETVNTSVENSINEFITSSPIVSIQSDVAAVETRVDAAETNITNIISNASRMDLLYSGSAKDDFTMTSSSEGYDFLLFCAYLNTNTSLSLAVAPYGIHGQKFQIADNGYYAVYSFEGATVSKYTGQGNNATMAYVYGVKL